MSIRRRELLGIGALGTIGALVPARVAVGATAAASIVEGGDTRALVSAIEKAPPGAAILVRRGRYVLPKDGLTLSKPVRLAGEGRETVLAGTADRLLIVTGADVVLDRLVVETEIRLEGSGAGIVACELDPPSGPALVVGENADRFVVESCTVHAPEGEVADGIRVEGARVGRIQGCRIVRAARSGVLLRGGGGHAVTGNVFEHCGAAAVTLTSTREVSVTGNVVRGGTAGIEAPAGGPSSGLVVAANVVRGNARSGIALQACTAATVANNQVAETGTAGILLDGCTASTVIGNVVQGCGEEGIRLLKSGAVACTGNVCRSNGREADDDAAAGIGVDGDGSAVVAGNVCDDPEPAPFQNAGLRVAGTGSVLAPYNVLRGYGGPALVVDGDQGGELDVFVTPSKALIAEVGRQRASISHGLGYAPRAVTLQMTSPGRIWLDGPPDGTAVHLRADGSRCTARLTVG